MQFSDAASRPSRIITRQIVGVDAIRCLAAVLVMIFHFSFWIWAGNAYHPGLGTSPPGYAWLAPFTSPGWVGVQIFFVISGLVIVYSAGDTTPFRFFRSRFLRLVPAAWICSSITMAALLISGTGYASIGQLAKSWLKAVIFYPFPGWIDNAYWTLGIELGFYAVVFAAIACGMSHRIFRIVGLIGLVSSAFWILALAAENTLGTIDSLPRIAIFRVTDLLLLHHGCFFALGTFLCLAMYRRLNGLELGCALVFGIGGLLEIRYVAHVVDNLTGVHRPAITPMLIWFICIAAIVAAIRWNSVLAGFGPRFVSIMRLIGLMTYPLYLLHQFVGYVIINAMRQYVADSAALVIAIAVCLFLAFIISRYVEPAVRAILAAWLTWAHTGAIGLIERA
jgi:peptidoglycan/LPS O-acetylase OafA/YrhL